MRSFASFSFSLYRKPIRAVELTTDKAIRNSTSEVLTPQPGVSRPGCPDEVQVTFGEHRGNLNSNLACKGGHMRWSPGDFQLESLTAQIRLADPRKAEPMCLIGPNFVPG